MADDDGEEVARPGSSYHAQQKAKLLVLAGITRKLREDLDALTARVDTGNQGAGGEQDDGGGATIAAQVKALRLDIDRLRDAHDAAPPPFHFDDLSPEDRAERETQMREWVRGTLTKWHPTVATNLRPCWDTHLEIVAAVQAAWLAWCACYRATTRRGTDPASWHKDWLPALHRQLRESHGEEFGPCVACERTTEGLRSA